MSAISVREFSHNPSAVFARVEKGEAIQVTRHYEVAADVDLLALLLAEREEDDR